MTQKQVLKAFKDTGALLEGHFELRSKLHSNRYFQCANVLRYPRVAEKLCRAVTREAVKSGKLGKKIDGVISPAKPNTVLALRRFAIKKGERYVVAEDVVTKGGRVQETIDLVKAAGGKVAGVILLVDRSGGKVKFGRIPMFSLMQMTPETWTADECPMCKSGSKPVHPGS